MSSYWEALRQALILFPILAILFTVPYIAVQYRRYGSVFSLRILIVYSFVLYLLCVYCLVILPLPSPQAAQALQGHRAQLIPFAFLSDMADTAGADWAQLSTWPAMLGTGAFLTTLFNLFMTMPFGMYLRYYFRCSWRKTLVLSFLLSLFFELTQLSGLYFLYPGSYRIFDVDDLFTNTCGSMIGYALAVIPMHLLPSRAELDQVSLIRAQQVSFLRRGVAFLYDAAVGALLTGLLLLLSLLPGAQILRQYPALPFVVWMLYFMLCPLFPGHGTLGHRMTRLKLVTPDGQPPRWYQAPLRYLSLFAVLFWAPWGLNLLVAHLTRNGTLTPLAMLVAFGVCNGSVLFLFLLEGARMAARKPLFHERLSRTRLVSTVTPPAEPRLDSPPAGGI